MIAQKSLEFLRRRPNIRYGEPGRRRDLSCQKKIDAGRGNLSDLHKEVGGALSTVGEARTEYSEQRSRLQAAEAATGESSLPDAAADAYQSSNGRSFFQWLQIGLALTLPRIIFGAVALLFFFWMASK